MARGPQGDAVSTRAFVPGEAGVAGEAAFRSPGLHGEGAEAAAFLRPTPPNARSIVKLGMAS
jgi:hypothetical protein